MKRLICYIFHRKFWQWIDSHSTDIFEYQEYYCPKCDWYFWDDPFDQEEKK